jgi:hypothetical protein
MLFFQRWYSFTVYISIYIKFKHGVLLMLRFNFFYGEMLWWCLEVVSLSNDSNDNTFVRSRVEFPSVTCRNRGGGMLVGMHLKVHVVWLFFTLLSSRKIHYLVLYSNTNVMTKCILRINKITFESVTNFYTMKKKRTQEPIIFSLH